jgi:pimeloyl-ACP methyl ester carboxylesterase
MKLALEKVTTTDNYILHGLLFEPKKQSKTIIIHIHGSAGNCYQSNFYPYLFKMAKQLNIAFLTTNSRGTGVYDVEKGVKYRGAAIEIFEECLLDIDKWIEFALSKGYKNIILEGHSFGTNKIQYYVLSGKYKIKIKSLILLGFTDSYGGQLEYLGKTNRRNEDVLKEAKELIKQNKPLQLLSDLYINWGELPQSAQSYKSFMTPGSALSNILPLGQKKVFTNFKKISIPILGVVGDTGECTVISPKKAVDKLNKENTYAKCFMIKNCNHMYKGKGKELIKIIKKFLKDEQTRKK